MIDPPPQNDAEAGHPATAEAWSMLGVLNCAISSAERDDVCVGDMTTAFGPASFVPLLLLPALALVSPLSGIPFFSSLCGLTILLVALQMLAGRSSVWLPGWLKRRAIAGSRLRAGLDRLRPMAVWFDRHAHQRFCLLFRRPFWYLLPLACALLALLIPFLELVPFSSSLLGASVALISLGMLTRDGVWVFAGLLPLGAVAALLLKLFG